MHSTFPCHQSRAFLYGGADAFVTAEITGQHHRDSKANPLPPEVSEADLPTIVKMLEEDFNVVTPLCDTRRGSVPSEWREKPSARVHCLSDGLLT